MASQTVIDMDSVKNLSPLGLTSPPLPQVMEQQSGSPLCLISKMCYSHFWKPCLGQVSLLHECSPFSDLLLCHSLM